MTRPIMRPTSPARGRHIARLLAAAALLLTTLSVASCGDSPTGPNSGRRTTDLLIGTAITGHIASPGDTATYALRVPAGYTVVIYFQAPAGWLSMRVTDSTGKQVGLAADGGNIASPQRRGAGPITGPALLTVTVATYNTSVDGDYRIEVQPFDVAPESISPAIAVGNIVSGEAIDHGADVDEFTFTPVATDTVVLYLKTVDSGATSLGAALLVPGSSGTMYYPLSVATTPGDTVLQGAASPSFIVAAGTTYRLRIGALGGSQAASPVAYAFQLRRIDRRPEERAAEVAPGDTVRSAIDYVGDVDEFTLVGTPGSRVNIFLGAGGSGPHAPSLCAAPCRYDAPLVRARAGSELASNATGTFVIPDSGRLRLTVGEQSATTPGIQTGPYTFYVYPIDPRPENADAHVGLGSGFVSQLDRPGDVDEWLLHLSSDTLVDVVGYATLHDNSGLVLDVLGARDSVIASLGIGGDGWSAADSLATGRLALRAGDYKVRVRPVASLPGTAYVGQYTVFIRPILTGPELASATLAIGDTVSDDVTPGDIDIYPLQLAAGDSVYLSLRLDQGPLSDANLILFDRATGATLAGVWMYGGGWHTSAVAVIPRSGEYQVIATKSNARLDERGRYTFAVSRVGIGPESGSATATLGDTLRSQVEAEGDVDQFHLAAPAGAVISARVQSAGCCAQFALVDPSTGAVLATQQSAGWPQGLGRVTVPSGGEVLIRVDQTASAAVGPYFVFPYAIDRAPEGRPAAFVVGDTVAGDSIYPSGDIDEFTFDASAGDTVDVFFQTPRGPMWEGWGALDLALIDPSGATLATLSSYNPTDHLEDIAARKIVLPTSGRYLVRVEGSDDRNSLEVYRFRVAKSGS